MYKNLSKVVLVIVSLFFIIIYVNSSIPDSFNKYSKKIFGNLVSYVNNDKFPDNISQVSLPLVSTNDSTPRIAYWGVR